MNKHLFRIGLPVLVAGLAVAALVLLLQRPTAAEGVKLPPRAEVERSAEEPLLRPATLPYTTFVVATIGSPATLDPHWMYDTSSGEVVMQVYETLLFYERERVDKFVPLLATDWSISPDGKTYTFTIREGVTFHAGGNLTPEDVAYSFWHGLLQDRSGGPMWLLLDPLLGVYDIDDYPGDDDAKCQAVKNAVTYDNANGTVTFHLTTSFGPFLNVLATPFGSVLDKEWMAATGGWGGSCTDWRDYHDPAADESILFDRVNGTGPFMLSHWTTDEVALARNDDYWLTEPLWGRGPAGPPALEQVLIKRVDDWATRYDMLVNGDTDFAHVPGEHRSQLDPFIWTRYEGPDDETPALVNLTGIVRLYENLPSTSATDLFFVFDIETDTNPYIGSSALDGNGIPPDFFSDLHVRKAFNYAFDWTTYISDAYGGEAIQRRGPIPAGMMGYDSAQPAYFYSPTLSMQEFQQAWGGQVWTNGFSLTIAYNTGSISRQRACEILKQNIEAITDTFHINVVDMDWTTYLGEMRARRLPLFSTGWMEDYHHPHNWVYPYMHGQGGYSGGQGLPITLTNQFDAKIEECKVLTATAAARTCYAELQNMAYENAIDIFLVQSVDHHYERAEVRGWYHNPAYLGQYYYALSKGPLPTATTVESDTDSTSTYTSASGLTTSLEIPAGAVTETTVIVYTPDIPVYEGPGDLRFAGQSFALDAYQGGKRVPGFTFNGAVTVTISYQEGLDEKSLVLYAWDGSAWGDAACGPYQRDIVNNTLMVPICHLSDFAVFGELNRVYLPVVLKSFQ
jgi:peptide/nickel transport system substrate-binding protein